MRVGVVPDRCEGNMICLGIAPEVFDVDDDDYVVILQDPVAPDQEALAEKAIAECPRAALFRVED